MKDSPWAPYIWPGAEPPPVLLCVQQAWSAAEPDQRRRVSSCEVGEGCFRHVGDSRWSSVGQL